MASLAEQLSGPLAERPGPAKSRAEQHGPPRPERAALPAAQTDALAALAGVAAFAA